jgi:hypothetical protein
MVFRFSPGFFLAEVIKTDRRFLAPYVRRIWELDPYNDQIAKRLARYLRGEWKRNIEGYVRGLGKPRFRTWEAHFKDAGIDVEAVNKDDPARTIRTVREQLAKLYDCNALAECGREIYHPDDVGTFDNLPRYNKLKAFLALRVHLGPTAEVADELRKTRTQHRALAAKEGADAKKRGAKNARK